MADAPAPPTLPPLEDWVHADGTADRPFGLGPVNVVARTVIYEDATIRECVPATTDGPWRFLPVNHLEIRPHTPPSRSLAKLVDKRASTGFRSCLETRGSSGAWRVESRTFRVRAGGGGDSQRDAGRDDDTRGNDATESEADVARYAAAVELAGVESAADAYPAVTSVNGEFLLIGGVYPREIRGGDGETVTTLREAIEPERSRKELFCAIRGAG